MGRDATGAEEEKLLHAVGVGGVDDVGFDHQVLVDEFGRIGVVGVDAADLGGGQVDLVGPLFGKEGVDCLLVGEVELGVSTSDDLWRGGLHIACQAALAITDELPDDGRTNHSTVAGDVDSGFSHDRQHSFVVIEGLETSHLDQRIAPGRAVIGENHFLDQLLQAGLRRPAELLTCFARVAEQGFDFRRAKVARVDLDDHIADLDLGLVAVDLGDDADLIHTLAFKTHADAEFGGGEFDELANAVLHAGGDNEVFGMVLLQHQPLHFDVVARMAPVAQGAHVAEVKAVLQAEGDAGDGAGDLAGDEGFAAHRAFVIEEDTVAGVDAVGLTVVDGNPVGVELGDGVGAARVEGGALLLRGFLHQAVEFGGAGLVEAALLFQAEDADGFEYAQGADAVGVGGVFGLFKADRDVALRGEVVDFVGLHLLNDADQAAGIGEVAVVQDELAIGLVLILLEVIDAVGVEERRATLDAVDFVAFVEEKLGEVGAVLAGDAGDEGDFVVGGGHVISMNVSGEWRRICVCLAGAWVCCGDGR